MNEGSICKCGHDCGAHYNQIGVCQEFLCECEEFTPEAKPTQPLTGKFLYETMLSSYSKRAKYFVVWDDLDLDGKKAWDKTAEVVNNHFEK